MKKPWLCIIISMFASICLAGSGFAQVPSPEKPLIKKVTPMTVKGKIVYSATMKRYVLRGRGEMYRHRQSEFRGA